MLPAENFREAVQQKASELANLCSPRSAHYQAPTCAHA
jgi:hypothetical protein